LRRQLSCERAWNALAMWERRAGAQRFGFAYNPMVPTVMLEVATEATTTVGLTDQP
jgi:hypothetical protein